MGSSRKGIAILKSIAIGIVLALTLVSVFALGAYLRDIGQAYERVQGQSTILTSPFGDIEYTEIGSGIPVLVIHGAGGGYDQGELIARTVLDERFRWIIPSRFGYLGSTLPEGAAWDEQADAYAYLLDHLGIANVAVVAMSQGGPSALLFSVLHPERVSSLTCLSCGVVNSATADQAQADQKGNTLKALFKVDAPFWIVSKLFKRQLMVLIGADEKVIGPLTPPQRDSIGQLIEHMNPASLRAKGVAFDNEATLPGARISAIKAPTLLFHAEDDGLQLYHNAEFAASTIPEARLVSFKSGGHIVTIVEQTIIREMLQEYILDRGSEPEAAGT